MYSALLVCALLHTVDTSSLPVAPAPRPAVAKKLPPWRPTSTYYGEVMAVDARFSITLRGNENNDNAPKVIYSFPAGNALLRGEQDPRERSNSDYRLSDVKVGDIVYIMIHHSGEDNLCAAVRIQRRPGGEVPRGAVRAWRRTRPLSRCDERLSEIRGEGNSVAAQVQPRFPTRRVRRGESDL